MSLTLLEESPLAPPSDLGPYRASDYAALPDEPRCELISGRFYVTPSPTYTHQATVAELVPRFERAATAAGGKVVFAPMDVTLADHSVVQPDLIYISPERRHILAERIQGAPDLLVEVLSPGTTRRDRGEKLDLYARSGVREYWIVDCVARQIEFLILRDGQFVVHVPSGGVFRSQALPGLDLDLADFWAALERRLA
ncbi:MAG TPA: Uma2 family endonuclease [Thermoanaerobaculia bacterium]|nr:Uma2 family endonuclease [Thermoanaerobaculia bacterium]